MLRYPAKKYFQCLTLKIKPNQNRTKSIDNNSLIKFEIALLLTESLNQLLTDKDDTVGIASPGSSSGVLKTGQLKQIYVI